MNSAETTSLEISPEEWEKARNYFAANPAEIKMRKPPEAKSAQGENQNFSLHSFIKVNDKIYGLANASYLGEGGTGKVKLAKDEAGNSFAVKIEGRSPRDEEDSELKILKMLEKFYGQAMVELPSEVELFKTKEGHLTSQKLYTVMQLEEGEEIHSSVITSGYALYPFQVLILAMKMAMLLETMHRKGIIHGDVKEANFVGVINDNNIKVELIDFGYAVLLEKENKTIKANARGTETYVAPEIINKGLFSPASDVYALGRVFNNIVKVPENLIEEYQETIKKLQDPDQIMQYEDVIAEMNEFKKIYESDLQKPLFNELINNMMTKSPAKRLSLLEVLSILVEKTEADFKREANSLSKEERAPIQQAINAANKFLPDQLQSDKHATATILHRYKNKEADQKADENISHRSPLKPGKP